MTADVGQKNSAVDTLFSVYDIFNRIEGLMWFGIAGAILFVVKRSTRRQTIAIFLASFGFILFGITDFIEAPLQGHIPWWLWLYKIATAALILSCRFIYLGWHRFNLRDRFLVFGLFCLAAVSGVMVFQQYLYAE